MVSKAPAPRRRADALGPAAREASATHMELPGRAGIGPFRRLEGPQPIKARQVPCIYPGLGLIS